MDFSLPAKSLVIFYKALSIIRKGGAACLVKPHTIFHHDNGSIIIQLLLQPLYFFLLRLRNNIICIQPHAVIHFCMAKRLVSGS